MINRQALRSIVRNTRDRPRTLSLVFDGGPVGALRSVSRAMTRLARSRQAGSSEVVSRRNNDGTTSHFVPMGRRVGYIGGYLKYRPSASFVELKMRNGRLISANPWLRPALIRQRGGRWSRTEPTRGQAEQLPSRRQRVQSAVSELGLSRRGAATVADNASLGVLTRGTAAHDRISVSQAGQYVRSLNPQTNIANWVSWRVTAGDVEGPGRPKFRTNDWRPDRSLPPGMYRATNADYLGYREIHTGHLVDSGSRQASQRANSATFLLSNNVPQMGNNNTGPWRGLEYHLRELAQSGHTIHVMAGPSFEGPRRTLGSTREGEGVAIPDAMWKVAVVLPPGQRLSDINARTRVIAVSIPNDNERVTGRENFDSFRTTPAAIEQQAGVRFFSNLPAPVAAALRQRIDSVDPEPLPGLQIAAERSSSR